MYFCFGPAEISSSFTEHENSTKEKKEVIPDLTGHESSAKLILFNDDFNTFDFVIKCLINICALDNHQAEQITVLVHYKGKAKVKQGDPQEMKEMCDQLCDEGLSAEVH